MRNLLESGYEDAKALDDLGVLPMIMVVKEKFAQVKRDISLKDIISEKLLKGKK